MADQRIQCSEEMVGAGHPTKQDTLNRLMLVEHENDGTHKLGNIHGFEPTDSPEFVTVKLSGLSDGVIPYNVDAATGLADGPSKTDVDDAVTKKHAAVTIDGTSPLSLSGQAISLKNDADAAITEVDTGTLANSDTVVPTSKAVLTKCGLYLPLAGGTMTGNIVMPDGGTIGQAAGPLLAFDDTNNYLEITGCNVGIGTATPDSPLHVVGIVHATGTFYNLTTDDEGIYSQATYTNVHSGVGHRINTTHNITTGTIGVYNQYTVGTLNVSGGTNHTSWGTMCQQYFNLSNAATMGTAHCVRMLSNFLGASPSGSITALYELSLQTASEATGSPSVAITTHAGLMITNMGPPAAGITVTTAVGLDIGNQSGATNNYAIRTGTGIVRFGDYVTTVGGLHVGGTSDPGTDNLLVDGTGTITGAFGCNGKTAQTAYARSSGDAAAKIAAIEAALVANGIMS